MPGWYPVKIRPEDTLFSIYIRTRDNWHCKYGFKCNKLTDYSKNKGGLDCSHFQKRRKETTRFDPDNCDAGCKKCHWFIENDPAGQKTLEAFKLEQLGRVRYARLMIRANTIGKRDDKMAMIYVKQLLAQQKQKV